MDSQKTSLVVNFFENPEEMHFIELWNMNSDMAMKCLFYILDQKREAQLFVELFGGWVYKNHRKTFFRNLSLILGIYNEKILTDESIKEFAKVDYEANELKLKEMLEEEYRETFRREFFSRVRHTYFTTVYKIPVYGSVEIMKKLQSHLKENGSDNLVYHTIEHLIQKYETEVKVPNVKIKAKPKFEEQYQFVGN